MQTLLVRVREHINDVGVGKDTVGKKDQTTKNTPILQPAMLNDRIAPSRSRRYRYGRIQKFLRPAKRD